MSHEYDSIKKPNSIFDIWTLSKDKAINELGAAISLFEALAIDASSLKSTKVGDDPPDCTFTKEDRTIGIEVVGLVDKTAREQSAASRMKRPKTEEGGLWKPDTKYTEFIAIWSKNSLRQCLTDIVAGKEKKIGVGKANGTAAASCAHFWLLVHSDEATLTSEAVTRFLEGWKLRSVVFEKAFLILSYEPGHLSSRYPVFELL